MTRAVGYLRVSTEEQASSGLGLADQRAAIAAEAAARGWHVEYVEDPGASAKSLDRPGIIRALRLLAAGEAEVLVVAKFDRLSRSVGDFAALATRAGAEGWAIVALDLGGLDTATPIGEFVANVTAAVAQLERRLIGARTKAALAQRRARGLRHGRPSQIPHQVLRRITDERAAGATLAAIADRLNRDQVPTVRGGVRWHRSTVDRALQSARVDMPETPE